MKTNALSALGRLSYTGHLALYPIIGGSVYFTISGWMKSSAEKAKKEEIAAMPAARPVDPDNF